MRIIEIPMLALQRLLGMNKARLGVPAPNLILFGLFAFLPVILNVSYATTGGDNVLLADRPDVGLRNFVTLTDCESFLDPNSCREDKFWRAVWNTTWFVTLQVGIMVGFSLLTAIILNRDIRARGFFRSVFFFPVLLSPVVVALIWKWILQREGVLNAFLDWTGIRRLQLAGGRAMGLCMVGLPVGLGQYGVLHADPAGGPAGDPARRLRGRDDGPRLALARVHARSPCRCLMPTMLVVLVLALIKGVQTFDEIYAFTGGGPGTATTFIIQYIYEEGFAGAPRLFGLAAAASLMVAGVLVILTLIQLWVNRRNVDG
jgi:alpha-1,4-digalacturonate transport system permease protein